MKKIWIRFLCLSLAWVCLVPTAVSASNGKAAVAVWRDISAQSFCLMDADTEEAGTMNFSAVLAIFSV